MISIVGILENIRSAHNVGSIFRSADAAGISHLYLSGYTPAPIDRFDRPLKEIAKTALGAEKTIPWTSVPDIKSTCAALRKEGYVIVALEAHLGEDIRAATFDKPVALIVGNEVEGISEDAKTIADHIVHIPMYGSKESLNVSAAFAVAVFRIREILEHAPKPHHKKKRKHVSGHSRPQLR